MTEKEIKQLIYEKSAYLPPLLYVNTIEDFLFSLNGIVHGFSIQNKVNTYTLQVDILIHKKYGMHKNLILELIRHEIRVRTTMGLCINISVDVHDESNYQIISNALKLHHPRIKLSMTI